MHVDLSAREVRMAAAHGSGRRAVRPGLRRVPATCHPGVYDTPRAVPCRHVDPLPRAQVDHELSVPAVKLMLLSCLAHVGITWCAKHHTTPHNTTTYNLQAATYK
jgi:hypothetical protein